MTQGSGEWPVGFEGHQASQRRAWLALTYKQRLEWLEQARIFARAAIKAAEARRLKSTTQGRK